MIDKKIFKNIMFNFLLNVIKYFDFGMIVWLMAWFEQGIFKVWVQDEGIGILESD